MIHFLRLLLLAVVLLVPDELPPSMAQYGDEDLLRAASQTTSSMMSDPQVAPADPDGDPLLFDRISLRVAALSLSQSVIPLLSLHESAALEHPFRPPRA